MVLGAAAFAAAAASPAPWSFLLAYGALCGLFVAVLWQAGRLANQLWWRPRRLERALRAQGLRGTAYRFPAGDLPEYARMNREAWARPLPLRCHDIAPRVAPFLHRGLREHGRAPHISWFGPAPKVTIADREVTRDVMSNKFGHFEKLKFPALSKMLGSGVAGHEGEEWVRRRRILNPAFHLEKLKRMLPAFSSCCEEMVSRWVEFLGEDGSRELDVWPELQNLTGDVISRTAFSSSYHEGRRIFKLQAEQVERTMTNMGKIVIPGYMSLPTKINREMRKANEEIESILRDIVGKRIQAMKQGESTNYDLLGLLLESSMRDTDGNGQSGMGMTIEDAIDECKVFYFAGMETTSVLLTWTMIVLSMHPEWQDCAREEVFGLFGKNKPEYEGLSHLKIVTMILNEVLRLYPPGTVFIRKTYKDMVIGGVTYPAGVLIEMPVLFIHHDPDIWGSDVHEFKPDRFAEGISKASKDTMAFFPFGWGPRICIGQKFALPEAKMALCMILQHFEFELAPSYTHAPHTVVTLHPMHGAPMKLKAI
ncbi:hypothetical protein ACP70R_006955 [Stipagrostis hirtigluma subsp. patula]